MQMRLSARRRSFFSLLAALVVLGTFGVLALRLSKVPTPRFEFLEHALHHTSGAFHETHNDGTGGWLTRWFTTPSRSPYLGNSRHAIAPPRRCSVYTYFDTSTHHRGSEESAILLAWTRAFWALGFKPVILT